MPDDTQRPGTASHLFLVDQSGEQRGGSGGVGRMWDAVVAAGQLGSEKGCDAMSRDQRMGGDGGDRGAAGGCPVRQAAHSWVPEAVRNLSEHSFCVDRGTSPGSAGAGLSWRQRGERVGIDHVGRLTEPAQEAAQAR